MRTCPQVFPAIQLKQLGYSALAKALHNGIILWHGSNVSASSLLMCRRTLCFANEELYAWRYPHPMCRRNTHTIILFSGIKIVDFWNIHAGFDALCRNLLFFLHRYKYSFTSAKAHRELPWRRLSRMTRSLLWAKRNVEERDIDRS